MNYKQNLFIYNRKEIVVFVFLCMMIAAFTFTLGVHFGKRLTHHADSFRAAPTLQAHSVPDQVPGNLELAEQKALAENSIHQLLSEELHQEVIQNGIQYHSSIQVDLPEGTKDPAMGSTSRRNPASHTESARKYTLQVGSFASASEAHAFQSLHPLKPDPKVHEIMIEGKGKWYRLYLGQFSTRHAAEQAGEKYRSQRKIQSFVVQELPPNKSDLE